MANTKPLLTIETAEPDRPFVEINGHNYFLNMPEDFGIRTLGKLRRMYARYLDLQGKDPEEFSEGDEDLLVQTIDEFTAMILQDFPAAGVQPPLRDNHKIAIIEGFGRAAGIGGLTTPTPASNRTMRRSRSTSASSSQRSSASTAAARKAG